ncbi:hypothetical protein V493_00698, partial [Pseudogymnoascus sp. VKM F-4281 (FW-2241)]
MTTVQEVAMDFPTIAGRFPVHERSISAPSEPSWRQNTYGESMLFGLEGPIVNIEQRRMSRIRLQRRNSTSPSAKTQGTRRHSRTMVPLIIPSNMNLSPERETFPKRVLNRISEQSVVSDTPPQVPPKSARILPEDSRHVSDTPPEVPPKSARMLPEDSPQSAQSALPNSAVPTITPFTPFTPLSALSAFSGASTNLLPLKFMTRATTPATPVDGRSSRAPHTAPATAPTTTLSSSQSRPSPNCHFRGLSESSTTVLVSRPSHRRTESEASIMDRGWPKKRSDGTSTKNTTTNASEQKAFETLPQGVKACDVTSKFSPQDIESLRRQALDQAAQFEVLAAKDVSNLSR